MKVAGKQIPWWVIAILVVVVGAAGFGIWSTQRSATGDADVALPPATAETSGTASENTTGAGAEAGKSTTTTTAQGGQAGGDSDGTDDGDGTDDANTATGFVVVKYWNDTSSKKPGEVEVVAGTASWKPAATKESDSKRFGPIPLDETVELAIYPDGRDGKKIVVEIVVTPRMSTSDSDSIHIEVRDNEVRVLGNPVVNFEVIEPRG